MMMAGERSLVNIISEVDIGGSTIKNEWKKAQAKGLIPNTERISYVGMHLATKRRSQGQPVQRISGKPYLDHVSKEHAKNKTPSASTGESKGIAESTGGKEREHDLSALSKEISTSLNSMRSELRNRLGSINTRLKNV